MSQDLKHVPVLKSLREQRLKALREALTLRSTVLPGAQATSLRSLCKGLLAEIRALDASTAHAIIAEDHERILSVLQFYGDPETYFAIGFFPDRPCGDFIEDFSETELGFKPGKRAREAMEVLVARYRSK
jgi:hypothetical protein